MTPDLDDRTSWIEVRPQTVLYENGHFGGPSLKVFSLERYLAVAWESGAQPVVAQPLEVLEERRGHQTPLIPRGTL